MDQINDPHTTWGKVKGMHQIVCSELTNFETTGVVGNPNASTVYEKVHYLWFDCGMFFWRSYLQSIFSFQMCTTICPYFYSTTKFALIFLFLTLNRYSRKEGFVELPGSMLLFLNFTTQVLVLGVFAICFRIII